MNKAFIFDMDGVLVDSERVWEGVDAQLWTSFIGEEKYRGMGSVLGMDIRSSYKKGLSFGLALPFDEFVAEYDKTAAEVYAKSPITEESEELARFLIGRGFKLGLVSSSRQDWIDQVLERVPFRKDLEAIVSLSDRADLKPKPYADGYIDALRTLDSNPRASFVLEDSNSGIQSGKAAGCYVIGFSGKLVPGYVQTGADVYASTMPEVAEIVKERLATPQ